MSSSDLHNQKSTGPLAEGLTGSTPSFSSHGLREEDAGCKDPVVEEALSDSGLLSGRSRDTDRIRIVKRLLYAPEGILVSQLVKDLFGADAADGSDSDYQFTHRFTSKLDDREWLNLRKHGSGEGNEAIPTTKLLSLISEGITQTQEDTENLYDKEFSKRLLQGVDEISEENQDLLSGMLSDYTDRIEDYRMLFEAVLVGRGGQDTRQFTKPYKTRFNDSGRVRKTYGKFNGALDAMAGTDAIPDHIDKIDADNAVLATFTTDPKKQNSIYSGIESINPNFNRLKSWLESSTKHAKDERKEGVPSWSKARDPSNYV